jgi:hypothetical protein
MRSGARVGFGVSDSTSTTASPFALRSISASSSSRYSSVYEDGSNSLVSESMSCFAMSISCFRGASTSSPMTSEISSGDTTSSAKRIVAIVSTSSIGRIAARFSLLRSTNRATATLPCSDIALVSRA